MAIEALVLVLVLLLDFVQRLWPVLARTVVLEVRDSALCRVLVLLPDFSELPCLLSSVQGPAWLTPSACGSYIRHIRCCVRGRCAC